MSGSESTDQFKQEIQRMRIALDSSPDCIFAKDRDYKLILVNQALADSMNLNPTDMEGHFDYEFWPLEKCEGDPAFGNKGYHDADDEALSGSITEVTEKVVLADGVEHVFSTMRTPLKDSSGNIYGVLGYARNITNDLLVKQKAKQLETINNELNSFNRSISHDLRNPLNVVLGWSDELLEEYSDQLDDKGIECVLSIRSEAQKMGQLVMDLLQLSVNTNSPLNHEKFNLSDMAESILEHGILEYKIKNITTELEKELYIDADKSLINIAMTNLIGNAIKYSSKKAKPHIIIGKRLINGSDTFFITDNGVGFNMGYIDELFVAFKRLNHAEDFPGTGIGLDTTRRIIHRHHGEIWAESDGKSGSTFYFTVGQQ